MSSGKDSEERLKIEAAMQRFAAASSALAESEKKRKIAAMKLRGATRFMNKKAKMMESETNNVEVAQGELESAHKSLKEAEERWKAWWEVSHTPGEEHGREYNDRKEKVSSSGSNENHSRVAKGKIKKGRQENESGDDSRSERIQIHVVFHPPHPNARSMKRFVKDTTKTIIIDVEPSDPIVILKAKIEDKEGIPQNKQRLYFRPPSSADGWNQTSTELKDPFTVDSYKFKSGSRIFLSIREDSRPSAHQQQSQQQQQQPVVVKITDASDHYQVLGLTPTAASVEIKKAYRKAALKYHPDRNPEEAATVKFLRVKLAYDVLGDHQAKMSYDAERRLNRN
jgi:hypothetical protein